jgi:lysozyme family protein
MYSPQITPFQPSNIDATTKMLMGLQQKGQLQQYVAQHKNDPNLVALALFVSNMSKAKPAVQAEANQPKVVDQAIAGMAPQQMMPEDQGIATLPAPNMQNMAGGGIVAFDEGGDVPGYAGGGKPGDEVFERAFKKVLKFEGGSKYLKDDAGKGPTKYGINQTANPDVDIKNLTEDQAKEIYRKRYWNAIGGDALAAKNPHLATIAFDAAVNQGPGTAKQMLAQAGDSPYELLKLRQQRYVDLKNQNPEKFGKYLGGWTERVASLQKDFEQDRSKQGLPALTPGAQALAATGSESTQPDLDKDKAAAITGGLATLGGAAEAVRQGMNMGPLNEVLRPSTRLGIAAPGAALPAAVGATGAALSTGVANALSNATPEQLDQLSSDIGSDTGIAAAIMNAPNRPPEKPPMPYGEQMSNALGQIGKTIVSHPDMSKPVAPEYAENKTAADYPEGVMGGATLPTAEEGIVAALKEKPEETIATAPKDEKTGGTDWNKLMLQMGLHLMSGKSPNMLTNIGEAGLGTLAMQQAEEKSKSEREAKMSEAEYRKAMGKYYEANAASIERGAKEKNLQLEAEKLIAQEISKDKFLNMPGQEAARAAREREMRATIYRNLGIEPTMAAGAPRGGAKFLGFENPA